MTSATVGATTTSYDHNGLGERVKKSDGSTTVYFAYDEAGHLIGEYDASGDLIQETVWFGDIPIATLRPDGQSGIDVYYVHADHLNTPRKISRPGDDEIVWRWDSDPFGQTSANEDPDADTNDFSYNLRFPGQYLDAETGLHYNYFRSYDPVTGRYSQSDPIGLEGGLNTYAYANGNPLRYVAPLGLDVKVDTSDPVAATILMEAYARVTSTRAGMLMCDPLEKSSTTYLIRPITQDAFYCNAAACGFASNIDHSAPSNGSEF